MCDADVDIDDLLDEIADLKEEIASLKQELEKVCKWPDHKKLALFNLYMSDRRLKVRDLANEYGVSPAFISKIFKQVREMNKEDKP